ncbi:MAG TPA: IS66 family transposase [Nevskia sp.]|nr:IS66 family transposase [Nevskia sp.]
MDDALTRLPDDPAALKAIIAAVSRQRDEASRLRDEREHRLQQRIDELEVSKLRLEVELLRLKKWYYGPRADTLRGEGEVAQMLLSFAGELEARPVDPSDLPPEAEAGSGADVAPDAAKAEGQALSASVRRIKRGRRNLAAFDHLPVSRHVHDLGEDDKPCSCCGKMRQPIGQDISWQVEYIPGHFERIEHVRLKYACKHCEAQADNPQITLADKPLAPIEKGMAGPGLLAYLITSKYADYLPLYRLENIFERNGLEISRSTQCVWCRDVAEMLEPLYRRMIQRILASHLVCTDDTIMPMLPNPGAPGLAQGKTAKARMWVYIGDQANPYNLFDFTTSRGRDGPMTFLKGYKQTLVADGYGGYDGVVVGNDITRAGCWAHARRKFVDAEKAHPTIAAEAVGIIKRLYAIEERGKPLAAEDRTALRQRESVPILAILKDKLHGWRDHLLPKHPMSQAIGYTLNQWTELSVFAADGSVPIDNNASEREIKRVVLNRKNSLFVGNPRGGHTAAVLSSFTATAKRHDIDPQLYLTQLLTNLPATPISQIDQWLPDMWKINQAKRTR